MYSNIMHTLVLSKKRTVPDGGLERGRKGLRGKAMYMYIHVYSVVWFYSSLEVLATKIRHVKNLRMHTHNHNKSFSLRTNFARLIFNQTTVYR